MISEVVLGTNGYLTYVRLSILNIRDSSIGKIKFSKFALTFPT